MVAEKIAFVFPGQGSQTVSMGLAWAERFEVSRQTFEEADEVLGFRLSKLCWEGPEEELQLTANTQPAILATSVAVLRAVSPRLPAPVVLAGHSLGEYTALVAAGALTLASALTLVRRRGELMQQAVPVGEGAMAAIVGIEASVVAEVAGEAAEGQVCAVANLNAPIQTVIAGHREAVERAVTLARKRGARRALLLPVSAPFHSPLMRPAREALTPVLDSASFEEPRVPVVSNIDARPVTTGGEARDALIRQVDGPVRWVDSVRWMVDEKGVERIFEIGPGNVLSGLIRRIAPTVKVSSIAEPDALAEEEGSS